METYMNTGVKDVIAQFPRVGEILEEYGIGCVPCTAGTCLLKDVVEIHNLSPDAEAEMMARIAAVIHPDRQADIPQPAPRRAKEPRRIRYSPPMQKLVDEHTLIKRWLAMVPEIVDRLERDWDRLRPVLVGAIGFIRNYADAYHHAKEEDVLFAGLDGKLDIIQTMRQDHERARALVRRLAEAVETSDVPVARACLTEHAELLQEHIKKEDEILYPWIDRGLSDKQVGQLFARFAEIDREFDNGPAEQEEFIRRAEQMLELETVKT
jgi:hemerythrin-like domain-containing protein